MARTDGLWELETGYIRPSGDTGKNVLVYGSDKYLNFGFTSGVSGYGFRDNSGTLQFKNSGGSWTNLGGGGASQLSDLSDVDSTVANPDDGDILVFRDAGSDWVLEAKPAGGSNPAMADITDVTITSVGDDDIIAYDSGSGDYINQTAAEAGLAVSGHTHTLSDVTDSGDLAALDTVGTTEIDDDAVTYAKIQDVSATNRILGRDSAGAGIVEEISPTDLRTIINVEDGATADQTAEEIQDAIYNNVLSGTQTLITVTYDDANNEVDYVVDNDLSNYDNSTSGFITDYTVTEADVTQHEGAITITESQISDLSHTTDTNLTEEEAQDFAWNVLTGTQTLITVTYDDANNEVDFVVDDDLSNYDNTTSGFITDYTVTSGDVTQHEGDIDHDALTNFAANEHFTQSSITTTGTVSTGTWASTVSGATIDGDNNTISNLDIGNEVDWAAAANVTDRSATPASGDKLLLFEAGVGLRKIDWDDLPSGGSSNNIVAAPQLFNPDSTGVSSDTDDFTLSNSNPVAFVSVNGQVLDDSEYSLSSSTLTVTPDNGFQDTGDEVLVFQNQASASSLSTESVQDDAWDVLTGTQTLITVTYDDANNEVDFVVDNDLNNYDNSTSGFFDASSDVDHDATTNFSANEHRVWENSIAQNIHDDNIAESSVTQHEAALSITESQISDLDHNDADAIHDNVAGEINAITSKATPVNADLLIIEDSEDSNNKKSITIGDLPSSGGGDPDQNLFETITDGTNNAVADTTTDTFKIHSTDSSISVTVANDDATHGDSVNLTANESNIDHDSLNNFSSDEHFTQSSITTVGTVTTGTWQGTDVGVSHGGTGASTASSARTNLGVAIGSDVQAWDDDLDDIAALTHTNRNAILSDGTDWESRAIVEADISDLGAYITASSTDTLTNKSGSNSQWTNDEGYITATLTEEQVEDFVGGMVTGNTETLISVTYEDGDGTLDFVVDNDLNNYDNSTSGFFDASSDVNHDSTTGFVANEHIDHSGVSISSGTGLSGGGDITTSRTLNVDINGTTDLAAPATDDELLLSDTSNTNAIRKADLASIVNLADHDQLTNFASNEHFTQSSITTTGTVTTGTWDSDLAADTVDAIGEIAGALRTGSDTTLVTGTSGTNGNLLQWNGDGDAVDSSIAASDVVTTQTSAITIESPTASEDITMFYTDVAITVTQLTAVLLGSSTPSVTYTIRHGTDRSATGNEVVTSGETVTNTTGGAETTTFNDASIPADSWVWFESTAQSGTVDEMNVTIEYN